MNDFFPKAIAIAIVGELGLALGLAQVGYTPSELRPLTLLGSRANRPLHFITATLRPPAPPPPPRALQPPPPQPRPQPRPLRRKRIVKAMPAPAPKPAPAPARVISNSISISNSNFPAPAPAPALATAPATAFGPGGSGPPCGATDSCQGAPGPAPASTPVSAPAPKPPAAAPAPAPIPAAVLAAISDRIDRAARRAYPEIARRRGIEGTVRVCFFVGPAGTPSNPVVDRTADDEDLDEAARAAVVAAAPLIAPRKMRLCKAIEYRLN